MSRNGIHVSKFLVLVCLTTTWPAALHAQHDVCNEATFPPTSLVCAFDSNPLALLPLTDGVTYISQTDLSQTAYETYLYPSQSNDMPASHRLAGEAIAAALQPLDENGEIDADNGKIVAVVEGMSNTFHETNALIEQFLQHNTAVNPHFKLINTAQPACILTCWTDKTIDSVDYQVQILILKHSNNAPQNRNGAPRVPNAPFLTADDKRFPSHALTTKALLKTRLLAAMQQYPNVKMVFFTSRTYGGWTCAPPEFGYREPVAFEEGFSVKWLIEDQILDKDPELRYSGAAAKAPWLAWGPYIWDPTWTQDMFSDGTHPCPPGQEAVAQQWYDFLMQDGAARPWFRDNVAPSAPANFSAALAGGNQANLSWTAANDNSGDVRYDIYRDGAFLVRTKNTSYSDSGLSAGVTHCYSVNAVDLAGNESAKSAPACVTTISTGVTGDAIVPAAFRLFENYPNPFNPETEIRFQVTEAAKIELAIFNTLGEKIRTLSDGWHNTGEYSVRWDGRDRLGGEVPSGVYLYQLRVVEPGGARFLDIKRMALLR